MGGYDVTAVLEVLITLLFLSFHIIFFTILCAFLPIRRPLPMRILAFILLLLFDDVYVYLNDLASILLSLLAFSFYIAIFHKGKWMEKITMVLAFYPIMISTNFMMTNTFSKLFFLITGAPDNGWSEKIIFLDAFFRTLEYLANFLL